jgi:hypothetical protein
VTKGHSKRKSTWGYLPLFCIFGLVAAFSTPKNPLPAPSTRTTSTACPYHTPEEWQQFLERYASNPKWVETCEDSACDSKFYEFVKENIQDTLENCALVIAANPAIDRCTQNIRNFAPAWMRQHDQDSYGFMVDNHTYLADQEKADRPEGMMVPPDAIVAALPDRAKVEKAARDNGWKYITHDSALGGSRTFVLVTDPEDRFDKWLLLNLTDDKVLKSQTPLSILAVQKKDAGGNAFPKVHLNFRDWTMVRKGDGYTLELNETNNGKCYSCHASGVRQLIARRTPILEAKPTKGEPGYNPDDDAPAPGDFAYERLMEFNRRFRSYGTPDWEGRVVPENHGPALGEAQGCTDCHDGQSRGILTVSTSLAQLQRKIYYELSMPTDSGLTPLLERNEMYDPPLNDEEQNALKQALAVHADMTRDFLAARLPSLKAWLLENPCR